jgi:hypothetical protein
VIRPGGANRAAPFCEPLRDALRSAAAPGLFGTKLLGTIPPSGQKDGQEIMGVGFSLKRLYTRAGHRVSVLSATCPDEAGPTSNEPPLAVSTFAFADGNEVSSKLVRDCTMRKPSP